MCKCEQWVVTAIKYSEICRRPLVCIYWRSAYPSWVSRNRCVFPDHSYLKWFLPQGLRALLSVPGTWGLVCFVLFCLHEQPEFITLLTPSIIALSETTPLLYSFLFLCLPCPVPTPPAAVLMCLVYILLLICILTKCLLLLHGHTFLICISVICCLLLFLSFFSGLNVKLHSCCRGVPLSCLLFCAGHPSHFTMHFSDHRHRGGSNSPFHKWCCSDHPKACLLMTTILNWGGCCTSSDIWQCLGTCLLVTARGRCCRHLVGRGPACC